MSELDLRHFLRDVPDFPKPGIVVKAITPLLRDPRACAAAMEAMQRPFADARIDAVLGIDARGFIFGACLADRLGAGFVPARKPSKLPAAVDRKAYSLEYGSDALEVHKGSFSKGDRVLVVDDVIATGGTAAAAVALAQEQGAEVVSAVFLIELAFLAGTKRLPEGLRVHSVLVL